MTDPNVSIIIPTYNAEAFLAETIESVLNQTYADFELIIVDDYSSDQTSNIVRGFDDPRINFIQHEKNLGADVARHTGLQASSGEIITFWDHDDLFHPENLQTHVAYLDGHPDIGITYNGRFELNYSDHSAKTIRDIWRPPDPIALSDLVLWFPLAPSDAFYRRKWALHLDLLAGVRGSEISDFGDLFLSGCKFAFVGRALNYRRHHSGRVISDLSATCQSEISCQEKIFADPRCPDEILNLRNTAHANLYMYWCYWAFIQNETALGQEFIRTAVQLRPNIIEGKPCGLLMNLLINCMDDESLDHESLLQKIMEQFPAELAWLSDQFSWAVAEGYLLKGTRAVIWGRPDDGRSHFEQAVRLGAQIDDYYVNTLTDKLLDYESEFGIEARQNVYQALVPYLNKLGGKNSVRQLSGSFFINRAFKHYQDGDRARVPMLILLAIANDPKYLVNRGVMSVLFRSALGS